MRTVHRTRLTTTDRVELLIAQDHTCPLCTKPLRPGDRIVDEHMRALGLGGTNDLGNRALVHLHCAEEKTGGPDGDLARIAHTKRQCAAVYGFKQSRRPLPGGKGDWRKRTIGGGCVDCATGAPL